MEKSEDQVIEKYAECMHCLKNIISPYEFEWSCVACGYNVPKQKKMNLLKSKIKKST